MIRLAAVLAILGLPAAADNARVWESNSRHASVELHDPTHPNAVASITFINSEVHNADEQFVLDYDGIEVSVMLTFNADKHGSERIHVTPPEGYFAWPEEITVRENDQGVVHIMEWRGM